MERQGSFGVVGLSIAGLGIVVALPILFVLLQAIFPHLGESSLREPFGAVREAFSDPRLPELFANTVRLGICVAACSMIVATPLAVLRALTDLPAKGLWDLLFLIPFMMPPYIGAFAWTMTLQPGGFSSQSLDFDGGDFLFSFWGIVAVMTLHLFPVIYFAASRTLAAIGPRFVNAARTSGASPLYAFRRIILPLSLPGLAASLLLVFAMSIEEYGTPATLGRRSQFLVLVTSIEERFAEWPIDLPGAAILSLNLVVLALGAFLLQHWIVTRRSYVTIAGKHGDASDAQLGAWRLPAVALFATVTLLAVVVPLAAVLITAFSKTLSGGLAWSNFGLRHFESVLSNADGAMDALFTSLWLAGAASIAAGALGLLAAYVTVRSRAPGRRVVDGLSTLPNALPGMVIAVGLILAWNRSWWPVQIYNTPVLLMLAYTCLLLPYPVRYAAAGLRQISESLEAAARVSGAGLTMTIRRIVMPMIAPHLAVAMLLVFAIASRELVASVMVAPPGLQTVSTYVFNQFVQGSAGEGMALSVIAIFSSTAILVAMSRFQKKLEH